MKNKKEIDFYGDKDNYIHLKFGDTRKKYNFTKEFIKKYQSFVREYQNYFNWENSVFENPLQIVSYVYAKKLPLKFYYNFTDTPAKSLNEIMDYLVRENTWNSKQSDFKINLKQ